MTDILWNHTVSRNGLDNGESGPEDTTDSTPFKNSDFITILIAKALPHISGHLNLAVHLVAWLANSSDVWNTASHQQQITVTNIMWFHSWNFND